MTDEEVLQQLCLYDIRNPDCQWGEGEYEEENGEPPPSPCYCDNCFYGRAKLALEILRLRNHE